MDKLPPGRAVFLPLVSLAREAATESMKEVAEFAHGRWVFHLESQDLPLVPLTKKYLQLKLRLGLDPRTLIASGAYLEAIVLLELVPDLVWRVGPDPESRHKPSGLKFDQLIRIHEFGTEVIPARPVLQEVIREALEFRRLRQAESFSVRLNRKLRNKGELRKVFVDLQRKFTSKVRKLVERARRLSR